jgi:hypothetical protein
LLRLQRPAIDPISLKGKNIVRAFVETAVLLPITVHLYHHRGARAVYIASNPQANDLANQQSAAHPMLTAVESF